MDTLRPHYLFLLAMLCACQTAPQPADIKANRIAFHGGRIWVHTPEADPHFVDAMVIEEEQIVFLGTDAQALSFAGSSATQIDLAGGMIVPGLIDGHLHPVRGGLKDLFHCNFPYSSSPQQVQQTVSACVAAQPDSQWIRGGQWDSAFFQNYPMESPRKLLDAVSKDKAVYLQDDSLHNVWVNSRALELAGIDADTPDPANGVIGREADGSPNGVLLETAGRLVGKVLPEYSQQETVQAIAAFMAQAGGFGLTGIKGASTYPFESAAFKAVDQAGGLTLHVATSLRTPDGRRETPLDYDALELARDQYRSPGVRTEFVKIFLDGVPTPARTAGMLEPYLHDETHPEGFSGGPLLIAPAVLAADMIELDRRGFTVKIHAAGDRSVRVALDAIEAARAANGDSGLRHELAHAGYVSEDDIPRFSQLGAVADLSPILWYPSPIMDAIYQAVGQQRGYRYFPVRDYIDSGAGLLAGSDWPAVAQDANPWVGVESLVTRRHPLSGAPQQLWPEQAISLKEALEIYTLGGAKALGLESETGSIAVGKLADFLLLERNLFEMPVAEISDVRPLQTWFRGNKVFSREP